jgi:thiol-disulfide isomerase/thioredoxin
VFVRIHVTNRHTKQVLYTKTASMSDRAIVRELFCGVGHSLGGLHEHDLEAYQDYKVAVSLIDLGGDGLRVAELRSVEDLVVEHGMTDPDFALLTPRTWTYGGHSFGSKWEAASICIDCEFMAHLIECADEEYEEDEEEPEGVWELSVVVHFNPVHECSGMDGFEPYHFKDIKAAYEFLEPFVDTPSLLKWN